MLPSIRPMRIFRPELGESAATRATTKRCPAPVSSQASAANRSSTIATAVLNTQCCHPKRKRRGAAAWRSEEHTSELQSLMRISYAVFCLKKKKTDDKKNNKV